MTKLPRKLQLLAPAKNATIAIQAILHGADAVYMGGSGFSARQAAANTTDDIRRAAEYAHRYGARLYATLNTVVFESELEQAEHLARELIAADVDALIIQDMAYREMSLPVELHASTQMCNMEPGEAAFLERCGFSRVVLERALSIERYAVYALRHLSNWSASSTVRYASATAAGAFCRGRCRSARATAGSAASPAGSATTCATSRDGR